MAKRIGGSSSTHISSHLRHTDLSTLAGDMVAAAVLLHGLAALRACLGVGLEMWRGGEEVACLGTFSRSSLPPFPRPASSSPRTDPPHHPPTINPTITPLTCNKGAVAHARGQTRLLPPPTIISLTCIQFRVSLSPVVFSSQIVQLHALGFSGFVGSTHSGAKSFRIQTLLSLAFRKL